MRVLVALLSLALLAACETGVPNDGSAPSGTPAATTATDPADEVTDDGAAATDETEEEIKVDISNNNPTISDTQDFEATKERLTPDADKARLEALKKRHVDIAPTALPTRGKTVNVAAFALQSKNKLGEKLYRRSNPIGSVMSKQACKRYRIADDAQAAFLTAGGPKKDPKNLDPDGDGFACSWDPDTYRKLLQ
jgi:hypothetical protein